MKLLAQKLQATAPERCQPIRQQPIEHLGVIRESWQLFDEQRALVSNERSDQRPQAHKQEQKHYEDDGGRGRARHPPRHLPFEPANGGVEDIRKEHGEHEDEQSAPHGVKREER